MNTPIENPLAFPQPMSRADDGSMYCAVEKHQDFGGMMLRDYMAARAMQGAIANGALERIAKQVESPNMDAQTVAEITNRLLANMVYELADAMLAARQQ